MMDARILIKHSASKCNKDLLTFLHSNIKGIKEKFSVQVVIVFDDLIPKLNGKIDKLPVLIVNGDVTTGISAIRKRLTSTKTDTMTNPPRDMGIHDLQDFWKSEMHSKEDNASHGDNDIMESVKMRALEQSIHHRESIPKKKKRDPIMASAREDNIQLEGLRGDKIADLVGNDPMAKKFWENQETTPGFD